MMYSAYFSTRPDCTTFFFNLQSNYQLHFFQIRGKYIFFILLQEKFYYLYHQDTMYKMQPLICLASHVTGL